MLTAWPLLIAATLISVRSSVLICQLEKSANVTTTAPGVMRSPALRFNWAIVPLIGARSSVSASAVCAASNAASACLTAAAKVLSTFPAASACSSSSWACAAVWLAEAAAI